MEKAIRKRVCGTRHWLLVALAVGGLTEPSWAQEGRRQQDEVHGDWTVRCIVREGVPPCDMVQVVTNQKTRQPVMVFSIGHAGRQEQYGIQIGVPLGVLVSGGALISIDGKEKIEDIKFTRCLPTGCQIEGQLEADKLQPLRQGTRGVLAILNSQGKPVIFPVSLKGFSAAMEAVAAKNRAWAKGRS